MDLDSTDKAVDDQFKSEMARYDLVFARAITTIDRQRQSSEGELSVLASSQFESMEGIIMADGDNEGPKVGDSEVGGSEVKVTGTEVRVTRSGRIVRNKVRK